MRSMLRYGIILGSICLVATGLLASVNLVTRPRIAAETKKEVDASLKDVLPQAASFEPIKFQNQTLYYKAFAADKSPVGAAFLAQGKGYSSTIETMVGMKNDGTITAIKVLTQAETPGLGARICEVKDKTTILDILKGKKTDQSLKPWFQEQFSGKNNADLDGISAITGATISSRAVINSVKAKTQEIQKLIEQ